MDNLAVPYSSIATTPARILPDESYLAVYDLGEEGRKRNGLLSSFLASYRWDPKKIMAALLIGMVAGIGVASFRMSDRDLKPEAAPQPMVVRQSQPLEAAVPKPHLAPVPAARLLRAMPETPTTTPLAASKEEMARIKERNRRLEALILVLRQRKLAPERKTSQDSTSLLGQ